jgi:hypothetical protein
MQLIMKSNQTFEEQYYSLINFLGADKSYLKQKLGTWDSSEDKENGIYVYYHDLNAKFDIKNNIVTNLSIPSQYKDGPEIDNSDSFFTLEGIKVGMSMEDVISIKGKPDDGVSKFWIWYRWYYDSKTNSEGKQYYPYITFESIGDDISWDKNNEIVFKEPISEDEWVVSEFGADFTEGLTFEQRFFKLSKLLGSKESSIVANLGEPDEVSVEEGGKRFLYYERYSAIFTIPSDYQFAECLMCPHPSFNKTGGYYNLLGVEIGDTRNEILNILGNPTGETSQIWAYANKTGTTNNGKVYELRLLFDDDNPNVVAGFSGMIIDPKIANSYTSKPKSGCFVATACYGNYEAPEVLVLRRFRDNVLLNSGFGKFLVRCYYYLSPSFASLIEKSEILKSLIRKYFLNIIVTKIEKYEKSK